VRAIGADLEKIEPRLPLFVEDYFTPYEQAQVAATAPAWRDTLITAIWSGKEAALKVVQLGLTVDTRGVECRIPPVTTRPEGWVEFAIDWRPQYLPQPFPPMVGWWRVWGELVLTIGVSNNPAHS
jgi:4'-phosphopantetheinyl transferase